jgi:hypothetical protein
VKTQLCKKYLRPRDARHGILLLVHQRPRPRGWTGQKGKKLKFPEMIAHLEHLAVKIAGSATDAPQPEIATLDMTSLGARASGDKKSAKAKSPKKSKKITKRMPTKEKPKKKPTKRKSTKKYRN